MRRLAVRGLALIVGTPSPFPGRSHPWKFSGSTPCLSSISVHGITNLSPWNHVGCLSHDKGVHCCDWNVEHFKNNPDQIEE